MSFFISASGKEVVQQRSNPNSDPGIFYKVFIKLVSGSFFLGGSDPVWTLGSWFFEDQIRIRLISEVGSRNGLFLWIGYGSRSGCFGRIWILKQL